MRLNLFSPEAADAPDAGLVVRRKVLVYRPCELRGSFSEPLAILDRALPRCLRNETKSARSSSFINHPFHRLIL